MQIGKISIIGDGGWGTAIALLLTEKKFNVSLWGYDPEYISEMQKREENFKFLPGFSFSPHLTLCSRADEGVKDADIIIIAVPTQFLRQTLYCFKKHLPTDKKPIICSLTKGVEKNSMSRPSEIIKEVLDISEVTVLSGPSHAEEVAQGLPTTVVAAAENPEDAAVLQEVLSTSSFRVYSSNDVAGVELGGALKNVIAVAVGICEGLGLGDNTRAALMTRGLAEMIRFGVFFGGREETFNGLSGMGDLITTCVSPFGRNRAAGLQLAEGKTLSDIVNGTDKVFEGIHTCESVYKISRENKIDMPITETLYKILHAGKKPQDAVSDLMNRTPKSEN
ncbi:MAG: NAD(P)H-dependent glycerol-3-phosphate dehydrogenase [Planctomycetota bacterium]|jgi:glycerol-3-phosphate dehydrogenase (NAD(P)+)